MILYDFNPHSLPPNYLRAVGLVVAASSQTEDTLTQFIGVLLGIDNIQALALSTHLTMPVKDQIIRSVAEIDAPNVEFLDEVDDLMDGVKSSMSKRNKIVHGSLAIDPDGNVLLKQLTSRGSLDLELSPISPEEIEEIAADVLKSGYDIIKFMTSRNLIPIDRIVPIGVFPDRGPAARARRKKAV